MANIVTHVVVLRRQPHHCLPLTLLLTTLLVTYIGVCRLRQSTAINVTVAIPFWLIVVCGNPRPPSLFVTLFNDVVLAPWALASDNASSHQANARRSSGCHRTPPSASVPTCGDGLFALSSSLLLSIDSVVPPLPSPSSRTPATTTAADAPSSLPSSLPPPPSAGLLLTKSLALCARGLFYFWWLVIVCAPPETCAKRCPRSRTFGRALVTGFARRKQSSYKTEGVRAQFVGGRRTSSSCVRGLHDIVWPGGRKKKLGQH